jgi:hypothetical protein
MPKPQRLLGERLSRVQGVVLHDLVPIDNGSMARWGRDAKGRTWVAKPGIGANEVLAEALAFMLGAELDVRQPQGAVFNEGGSPGWLSAAVPGAAHWDRDLRDHIANIDEVGRMLALDAIIFNEDRHQQNMLLTPEDDGRFIVWAIDAGNAELGCPADIRGRGVEPPGVGNHARGLPWALLHEPALGAAAVAASLPDEVLRQIVVEGCAQTSEPQVEALVDALTLRCRHAPAIVARYMKDLGARP